MSAKRCLLITCGGPEGGISDIPLLWLWTPFIPRRETLIDLTTGDSIQLQSAFLPTVHLYCLLSQHTLHMDKKCSETTSEERPDSHWRWKSHRRTFFLTSKCVSFSSLMGRHFSLWMWRISSSPGRHWLSVSMKKWRWIPCVVKYTTSSYLKNTASTFICH